jgi:trk system potassium uptake protein TrkA
MKWLGAEFDGVTVEGKPIDLEVLDSAGIRKADLFLAATSEDVVNAMAVQIAKEVFHVPLALARMTDPARERFYREMGLDTVCPTSTGINQILDRIQSSGFDSLKGYIDPGLAGIIPPPEWAGKKIGDLPLPKGRRLAGLERKGRIIPAENDLVLGEGDVLILRRTEKQGRAS